MLLIKIHHPDGKVEAVKVKRLPAIIGRSPDTDICIRHNTISRKHARLERLDNQHWLMVDLGSSNGITVRGKRVARAKLTDGSSIYIGKGIKLEFHCLLDRKKTPTTTTSAASSRSSEPQNKAAKQKENLCPACGYKMLEGAIVCLNCGFNIQLGKRMTVTVDTGVYQAPDPTAGSTLFNTTAVIPLNGSTTKRKKSSLNINLDIKDIIKYLPVLLIIAYFAIILLINISAGVRVTMSLTAAGLILLGRTIILLIAMGIAAKIGHFGFGNYRDALIKAVAIAAATAIVPLTGITILNIILPLLVLLGLLKLFFELDMFEMFLIVFVSFVLNQLLLMILFGTLFTALRLKGP